VDLAAVIREVKRLKPSVWVFQIILSHRMELYIVQEVLIQFAEYPFCGELVCGAYPEENQAIGQQVDIWAETSSYQVAQEYPICGDFVCGEE
jgi:hypothetical protein